MLDIDRASFRYGRRDSFVFENRSIAVQSGEMVGIAGKSGSGKSTMLFVASLLLRPSSGVLRVFGTDMASASDRRRSDLRRDAFGFIFQDATLDTTRTVLENIIEISAYGASRRSRLIERAHLLMDELAVDVPGDRRPLQVSGGQAQRIALCRALINEPEILFADEPTASLDSANGDRVIEMMRSHTKNGGAVLVASHDSRTLDSCDRIEMFPG